MAQPYSVLSSSALPWPQGFVGVLSWKHTFTSWLVFLLQGVWWTFKLQCCLAFVEAGPHPEAAGGHVTSLEHKPLRLRGPHHSHLSGN